MTYLFITNTKYQLWDLILHYHYKYGNFNKSGNGVYYNTITVMFKGWILANMEMGS